MLKTKYVAYVNGTCRLTVEACTKIRIYPQPHCCFHLYLSYQMVNNPIVVVCIWSVVAIHPPFEFVVSEPIENSRALPLVDDRCAKVVTCASYFLEPFVAWP